MTAHACTQKERQEILDFMSPGHWYSTNVLGDEMMIPRDRLYKLLGRMGEIESRRVNGWREWRRVK